MLNVTESVNGKLNIVLSDGYKSQLHDRGKVKVKGHQRVGKRIAKPRGVTQQKPKQNKESENYSKGTKPSRLAAKFNGMLSENTEIQTRENDKPKTKKSVASTPVGETAGFVTKNDLAKLLETLNVKHVDNVPTIKDEERVSGDPSDKISSTVDLRTNLEEDLLNAEEVSFEDKLSSEHDAASVVKKSNHEESDSTVMEETLKPVAMRSSFAIGAPGLVMSNPHDDKTARHRQWVKELEQQIQEKKEREKNMKFDQAVAMMPVNNERNRHFTNQPNNEKSQARMTVGETTHSELETEKSGSGQARGRALMAMLHSENEIDKQRKKIIEHQKAIELQVEDRRRQKVEERERVRREEALENDRLAREREKLQKQFQDEMMKAKEKEDQARNRARVLQEGISKAFESAQELKRDKRRNRMRNSTNEVTVNASRDNSESAGQTRGQQTTAPNNSDVSRSKDDGHVVLPLNLNRTSSRQSDSILNVKQILSSVRDVKTSYSEADQDKSETLMNKWVHEDFGSLCSNRERTNDSSHAISEDIIPFYRTASATLFTEEVFETRDELPNMTAIMNTDRKIISKARSLPEVQQTRTSRLREKGRDTKKGSISNRRKKHGAEARQQTDQRQSLSIQEKPDDRLTNASENISTLAKEHDTINIPSHLLATFTPTAHQEKILEQLATLRKGLLMKDQEIRTKVFHINENPVQLA